MDVRIEGWMDIEIERVDGLARDIDGWIKRKNTGI